MHSFHLFGILNDALDAEFTKSGRDNSLDLMILEDLFLAALDLLEEFYRTDSPLR